MSVHAPPLDGPSDQADSTLAAALDSLNPLTKQVKPGQDKVLTVAPVDLTIHCETLLSGVPYPACIIDAKAFILDQNTAFKTFTNIRQRCNSLQPNFLEIIDATHHERIYSLLSQAASSPHPQCIEQCLTYTSKAAQRKSLIVQFDWSFIVDSQGKFFIVTGKESLHDEMQSKIEISDTIAESTWQKFRERTRCSNEVFKSQLGQVDRKTEFLQRINDEVRSPLNAALSGLLILSDRIGSTNALALDDIKLSVLSVTNVLDQAIHDNEGEERLSAVLSAFPAAASRTRSSQDLAEVVEGAVAELLGETRGANVRVTRTSKLPSPIYLPFDANKMHAVVRNSVLCALRAARRDADVLVHILADAFLHTGLEITTQARLPRRLSSDGAAQEEGSVDAFVASMNSTLEPVKTFLGSIGGTLVVTASMASDDMHVKVSIAVPRSMFSFSPSIQLSAPTKDLLSHLPDIASPKSAVVATSTNTMPRLRFLVVDDVEMCRKMMIRRLERSNITCDQAGDGIEAVVKVMEASKLARRYDVIMLDNTMPSLNGSRASRMMREFGFTGLIYGVTGNVDEADLREFSAGGTSKVFLKPLSSANFDEIISSAKMELLRLSTAGLWK